MITLDACLFFNFLEWIVSGRRRMWGEMRKRKKKKKLRKFNFGDAAVVYAEL